MGAGIGGGLGYVLGNRLKNPTALVHGMTITRRAYMSLTFGLFGYCGVLFTGIKVIRVFSLGRSEREI